jgi:hypothetical protein
MPYTVTMLYAILVMRSRSLSAPVEILLNTISSAARPTKRSCTSHQLVAQFDKGIVPSVNTVHNPMQLHRVVQYLLSPTDRHVPETIRPRHGPLRGKPQCVFSSGEIILVFFSKPPITRSIASWKSCMSTSDLSLRAAIKAASLHTLAISAPAKPGVWAASFFYIYIFGKLDRALSVL